MASLTEQLIRFLNPKTFSFEASGSNGGAKSHLYGPELFAALNLAAAEYPLGLLVIKARYLTDDLANEAILKELHLKCSSHKMDYPDICALVIRAMLFDKPLFSQQKKIAGLYMQYGDRATRARRQIDIAQEKILALDVFNPSSARLERSYEQEIEVVTAELKRFAEAKAQETNVCPRCLGQLSNCPSCNGRGSIAVRSGDVQSLFNSMGLSYQKHQFLSKYWAKIVFIVSEFELMENDAHQAMQTRLNAEYRT